MTSFCCPTVRSSGDWWTGATVQSCHVAELIASAGLHHGGDTLVTTALLRAARSCTRLLTLVHRVQWAGCCRCWVQVLEMVSAEERTEMRISSPGPAPSPLSGPDNSHHRHHVRRKLSTVSGKKYVRISQHSTHTESRVEWHHRNS